MEIEPVNKQSPQQNQNAAKQPRYKSYWQVMLIVINLSLSNFYFGYCLVYISTVQFDIIMNIYDVSMPLQTARGVITGCIPFGALFGALIGKKLIHLFSRRKFILFINALAIISGSLIYVPNMISFMIMRVIQGACIGMYTSIVPITIAEISPIQISGSTGAFTQMFCSIGTTIAYLFYYILSTSLSIERQTEVWYYVEGLPLITLVIQSALLLFVFPYQTPKYFLLHHQKSKAKDLISILYKEKYVDDILHEKIEDLEQSAKKQKANEERRGSIILAGSNGQLPPCRLPSKASVHSALSGVQSQQLQTSPVSIFASVHLNILRQFVGINAVVAYAGKIVKKAIPQLKSIAPVILNFLTLLGALFSIYLLAKYGRKVILQSGTFVLAVSLLFITIGFFIIDSAFSAGAVLILMGLIIFMFTFGATLGTTIWLYIAEICEPGYIIIATVVTWIFASVVIVLFPILVNALPNQSPVYLFLFFFLWTAISFIINQKVVIQTKGKTQHEIRQQYKNLKIFGMGGVVSPTIRQSFQNLQGLQQVKNHQPDIVKQQSSAVILTKGLQNQIKPQINQQTFYNEIKVEAH